MVYMNEYVVCMPFKNAPNYFFRKSLLFIDDDIIVYGNDTKYISLLEIWSKYLKSK